MQTLIDVASELWPVFFGLLFLVILLVSAGAVEMTPFSGTSASIGCLFMLVVLGVCGEDERLSR